MWDGSKCVPQLHYCPNGKIWDGSACVDGSAVYFYLEHAPRECYNYPSSGDIVFEGEGNNPSCFRVIFVSDNPAFYTNMRPYFELSISSLTKTPTRSVELISQIATNYNYVSKKETQVFYSNPILINKDSEGTFENSYLICQRNCTTNKIDQDADRKYTVYRRFSNPFTNYYLNMEYDITDLEPAQEFNKK